ncbi:MAG TPA: 3-oxoacyl-[acyl-carrier-protein] synthase III C-terminal domain-containing protein [Terriglobales bacterium]
MRIAGVASALPKNYYTQHQIAAALKERWASEMDNPAVLDRLLTRVGVEGRHFALPIDRYDGLTTWGKANNAWIEAAEDLGEKALCRAVTRAGLELADLGAIFFVSVTGIASPSIDARLVNRMNLPRDIKRVPIFGLGCVAGAAGIARAADYVKAFPDQAAAVISVELCSLTWQREDLSLANIISSGLFGDGAASVILAGAELRTSGPRVLDTRSSFYPGTEDVMGWDISEKGFRIVLSPRVPEVVFKNLAHDVDGFLAEHNLQRSDVGTWIMHTGGPKVLEATSAALELADNALDVSWECLSRVGNLSSASVLLVLEEYMNRRRPEPGSYGVLAAMGPGFCAELVLVQW